MQYSDLTTALGDLMVVQITNAASATPSNDTNFNNILPRIIDDAEQRIYRELDFLATRSIFPGTVLQNQKYLQIPPCAIVVQGVSVVEQYPSLLGTSNVAGADTYPYTPPFTFPGDGSNTFILTDPNMPSTVRAGQYVNFPSSISFENGNIQGVYQILSTPTATSFTFAGPFTNSGTGPDGYTANYEADGTSNIITVSNNWEYVPPIGSTWLIGVPLTSYLSPGLLTLTLAAGPYTVTSVNLIEDTFTIQANEIFPEINLFENSSNIQVQYLSSLTSPQKSRIEIISKDALDIIWPSDYDIGLPQYGAILSTNTLVLAPTPDQNYGVEWTGVFRPAPISATNPTTYLASTYPDLFLAACMVFGMLYQKDADQPQGAPPGQDMQKWEAVYKERKASALSEVQRQKYQGTNWSAYSPTPESQPVRP